MCRPRFVALLLALITLVAYLPVTRDSFLELDDSGYVTENHVVRNGLTWAGVKWAFTTWHARYYWHPLTWLSHMADCELFGLNPGAQHYINVLFHTANVVLLFLLLLRLTSELWPAAFVAALFAWHPLHVESVAWIAERKDVLSTFFALLTLLAYTRYAQSVTSDKWQVARTEKIAPVPALSRVTCHVSLFYGLALFFFALGLMSKPMLVTLPFVMLLLDYWPLQRMTSDQWSVSKVLRLALEKWPFFLLLVVSCVLTFFGQRNHGAVVTFQDYPLNLRLGNALLSYMLYLGKAIWPTKLAVIYPLQRQLPWVEVTVAVIFLVVITWLVWNLRWRYPYLLVGWLWFLGTLVPVIGLIQSGVQAMADRFTYFPLVGMFIAVTFLCRDWVVRVRLRPVTLATAGSLILTGCLLATEHQLSYWKDSETLFSHVIAVTKNNDVAHDNLGSALAKQGFQAEALAQYQEALRINSHNFQAHNNLGNLLSEMGKTDEALAQYREAVELAPKESLVRVNLGVLLVKMGRFDEAINQCEQAARLDPDDPYLYYLMGTALLEQGRDAEAVGRLREALRLDPNDLPTLMVLASVLALDENPQIRNGAEAVALAEKANNLTGGEHPFVLDTLATSYAEVGRFQDAQQIEQRALQLAQSAALGETNAMNQRLELYKSSRPYHETFTNSLLQNLPKN